MIPRSMPLYKDGTLPKNSLSLLFVLPHPYPSNDRPAMKQLALTDSGMTGTVMYTDSPR